MNKLYIAILAVLIFLAVSSGITKIMLMQQDVDFFGRYGFTNIILVAFGIAQLGGGGLMVAQKSRLIGAVLVAITFAISLVLLILEGNIAMAIVTGIAIALLGLIMKQSLASQSAGST